MPAFVVENRVEYIYDAILRFAAGKRYVMRSPIRTWHILGWKEEQHESTMKYAEYIRFKDSLRMLEKRGLIRRFPGGIEVLENR